MNQLFLQLVQSVTGHVVTIVLLDLAAAIIGFVIAWLYAKSVYTPIIKGLEEDKKKLNAEISQLNGEVTGLKARTDELNVKISGLEAAIEKKGTEIKALKEVKVKAAPLGKYVISTAKSGEYYYNLKATNGQVILTSKLFTTADDCRKGIEETRTICSEDGRFERKLSSSSKPFFNLTTSEGHHLGKSEIYESDANMEKGIASVKKNGMTTNIILE
jgi:uncharacterized protein